MMDRPYILITNDDGSHAPGIQQLTQILLPIADVVVVAPSREQSGVAAGITLHEPIYVEVREHIEGPQVWAVTGKPADCVKMALHSICDRKPDLIVSGINKGMNEGRNIFYSGTVGAVIEGVNQGIPGIAFSVGPFQQPRYADAAIWVPSIVRYVLENPLPCGTFLNVNFPELPAEKWKGISLARQGKQFWAEKPDKRSYPGFSDHNYYWLGASLKTFEEHPESDVALLQEGYIAITPIHIGDMTNHAYIEERREHFTSSAKLPLDSTPSADEPLQCGKSE